MPDGQQEIGHWRAFRAPQVKVALDRAAGVAGGVLAARAAPFLLTPQTTLLPVAGIVVLGLAGAALAVRSITRVDPLLALGGN